LLTDTSSSGLISPKEKQGIAIYLWNSKKERGRERRKKREGGNEGEREEEGRKEGSKEAM
jgi:hypothetical protein